MMEMSSEIQRRDTEEEKVSEQGNIQVMYSGIYRYINEFEYVSV